jgi:hypothetical protein
MLVRSQPSWANSLRSISAKTFFAASLSSAIRFSWNSSLSRAQIEEWQIALMRAQENPLVSFAPPSPTL